MHELQLDVKSSTTRIGIKFSRDLHEMQPIKIDTGDEASGHSYLTQSEL